MSKGLFFCSVMALGLGWPGHDPVAQSDIPRAIQRASASVVTLTVYDVSGALLRKGSGFAVDDELLATNLHVVANSNVVELTRADGETFYARSVVAVDETWNLALLAIEPRRLKPLRLDTDGTAAIGATGRVIGGSFGEGNEVFPGVIAGSRVHDGSRALLEISHEINALASGGPLLDEEGRVLGITIFGGALAQNRNFAIPAAVLAGMVRAAEPSSAMVELSTLSEEARERLAQAQVQRNRMLAECATNDVINADRVIKEAIVIGAPIYNQDNVMACYKIYEGASYKLLYLLGQRCPAASEVLGEAVVRAAREETPGRKAWLLRYAFDTVLGVPTHEERPEPQL